MQPFHSYNKLSRFFIYSTAVHRISHQRKKKLISSNIDVHDAIGHLCPVIQARKINAPGESYVSTQITETSDCHCLSGWSIMTWTTIEHNVKWLWRTFVNCTNALRIQRTLQRTPNELKSTTANGFCINNALTISRDGRWRVEQGGRWLANGGFATENLLQQS